MTDNRLQRIQDLQKATKNYIANEKERIDNEVEALKEILNSRTGGAGIQSKTWQKASEAAEKDLSYYVKGT